MRLRKVAMIASLMLGLWTAWQCGSALAADGDEYVGAWKGTWEGGGGGGRFDLTLNRGNDGKLTGSVSVGSEMGDYQATFSTVTLTGAKLAGAYDYPPDTHAEVIISGSFDPKNATGTWTLGAKGQTGGQSIAGTWKVAKQ